MSLVLFIQKLKTFFGFRMEATNLSMSPRETLKSRSDKSLQLNSKPNQVGNCDYLGTDISPPIGARLYVRVSPQTAALILTCVTLMTAAVSLPFFTSLVFLFPLNVKVCVYVSRYVSLLLRHAKTTEQITLTLCM